MYSSTKVLSGVVVSTVALKQLLSVIDYSITKAVSRVVVSTVSLK